MCINLHLSVQKNIQKLPNPSNQIEKRAFFLASIVFYYLCNKLRCDMKKLIILVAIVLGFSFNNLKANTNYINIDYFYSALEPYGEWIEIGYNDFVWRPYFTERNWRPYTDGRWEWTNNGWYWVSYEPYGWATYHYGRWYYDDYYGWVWMPDNVWGPAWVEWRYDNYYIGWAPLPPYARFNSIGGIHFSIKWHSGYFYWNFVKYNHFVSVNIHNYYIYGEKARPIFNRTKYRTNYYENNKRIVNGGISRGFVENRIGRKIKTRDINYTNRKYSSEELRKRNDISEFRPSNNEVKRNRNIDRTKVVKGRELTNFKSDKVVINRNSNVTRSTNKTVIKKEVKTERKVETSVRSSNTNREKVMNKNDVRKKQNTYEANKNVTRNNTSKEVKKPVVNNTKRTVEKSKTELKSNRSNANSGRSSTKTNTKTREVVKKRK